ncbi:uncharacterized protein EV422DRAFT_513660 [Fimicolochytrium jonesii]|uniref:uncharacterized protein n=1 Tax=Fimicolochytrium jonesii TaxID=1396493 RepID=UPI0022FE22F1|nr:uncharacterized protein EV422DRAFT_513660 [Fimicolochytrium jonesii]KAI8825636.1 hypothetical protein EV422DRAFT_513660 [Fimicolochytrium jonesii]
MVSVPVGVYPLAGIMVGAAVGVGFFLVHKAKDPSVVWARRTNPHPYLTVGENETSKLYDPTLSRKKWRRGSQTSSEFVNEH